jgi:CRISPR/Cas system-associated protein endoribonuclease Cas2
MVDIMNKLNNLFPNDDTIEEVINYLKTNQLPTITNEKRFKEKYKQFVLNDGHLIYQPLNLMVIKKNDIATTLETLYKTDPNAFGKGIVTLYKYVSSKFISITRADVNAFLKKQ